MNRNTKLFLDDFFTSDRNKIRFPLLSKCKVIKSHIEAAKYSGEDVWLIPLTINHKRDRKKKPYVGDDWYICNQSIYGYHNEPCWIAVEK